MRPQTLLSIENLRKYFTVGRSGLWGSSNEFVKAIDGVSLEIDRGEVLALVGESGSGKSTLALSLMGLEEPTSGNIIFDGQTITHLKRSDQKEIRRRIQMVFQDPYESLNPVKSIYQIVSEPLTVHKLTKNRSERDQRVRKALEDVGLTPPEIYLKRLPHELSGGQRQRVVIAAALVLDPILLLADEPVSMLDVSIRAEILNLLSDLRRRRNIAVLLITHDLATAAYLADRVAVMYLGRIVEIGTMDEVLNNPSHPYTQALLSVIPVPNPRARRQRIILQGAPPNPIHIPSGCRFHPRCPKVFDRCTMQDPGLIMVDGTHQAACLLQQIKQLG